MRTAVDHLHAHVRGLRADIEHVANGALRHDWTPGQRAKIEVNERAIAILELVAHDRLADVDAEVAKRYGPQLGALSLDEWWKSHHAGVEAAIRVTEAHSLDVRWWERGRVRDILAALGRLRDRSAQRRG